MVLQYLKYLRTVFRYKRFHKKYSNFDLALAQQVKYVGPLTWYKEEVEKMKWVTAAKEKRIRCENAIKQRYIKQTESNKDHGYKIITQGQM